MRQRIAENFTFSSQTAFSKEIFFCIIIVYIIESKFTILLAQLSLALTLSKQRRLEFFFSPSTHFTIMTLVLVLYQ